MYTAHVHFFTNLDIFVYITRALSIEKYGTSFSMRVISESFTSCCKVPASRPRSCVQSNCKGEGEYRMGGMLPRREILEEKKYERYFVHHISQGLVRPGSGATTLGGRRLTT